MLATRPRSPALLPASRTCQPLVGGVVQRAPATVVRCRCHLLATPRRLAVVEQERGRTGGARGSGSSQRGAALSVALLRVSTPQRQQQLHHLPVVSLSSQVQQRQRLVRLLGAALRASSCGLQQPAGHPQRPASHRRRQQRGAAGHCRRAGLRLLLSQQGSQELEAAGLGGALQQGGARAAAATAVAHTLSAAERLQSCRVKAAVLSTQPAQHVMHSRVQLYSAGRRCRRARPAAAALRRLCLCLCLRFRRPCPSGGRESAPRIEQAGAEAEVAASQGQVQRILAPAVGQRWLRTRRQQPLHDLRGARNSLFTLVLL